jgi:hypothetical protein
VPLASSSSFRRDDRRRRLLTDDPSDQEDTGCRVWPEEDAAGKGKSDYYGNAEFLEQQWQLLDLVPRRLWFVTLLLLTCIAIIAGLEAAYAWAVGRAAAGGAIAVALDVGAKGSLACWFSALTLLAASVAALLVYTVRRYRTDDYQGRYRVWRWAAGCWFLLATDQAASLREAFRDAMVNCTGTPLFRDGTLWWVLVYVLVFAAVASRLMLDMRPSRLSLGALAVSTVAYGLAMAGYLGWAPLGTAVGNAIFRTSSEMAGHLMLLAAMGLHARYVILDAQGLVIHPEPRKVATKPQAEDDELDADEDVDEETEHEVKVISAANNRWRSVDPPHAAPKPTPQPAVASVARTAPTSTASPSPVNRKLTKGERRALKERLLRERREREGLE